MPYSSERSCTYIYAILGYLYFFSFILWALDESNFFFLISDSETWIGYTFHVWGKLCDLLLHSKI
jgi:hypothetical protein